ncbi:hypothetical protein P4O66_019783 [Electrophorus voltai]|uniref:Uncharacterized protein n=1 Tax=Electrophorus voltai TaxID=2609070 RepID=A0AAD8ZUB5_9TELE|nr:hypothetical protein P4O66_019783 [Electrophorus voltai]
MEKHVASGAWCSELYVASRSVASRSVASGTWRDEQYVVTHEHGQPRCSGALVDGKTAVISSSAGCWLSVCLAAGLCTALISGTHSTGPVLGARTHQTTSNHTHIKPHQTTPAGQHSEARRMNQQRSTGLPGARGMDVDCFSGPAKLLVVDLLYHDPDWDRRPGSSYGNMHSGRYSDDLTSLRSL